MPTSPLVLTLAYVNWTVLLALGLGSFAVVTVSAIFTPATRGYLAFTAFCAALLGLLCLLIDLGLPDPVGLAIRSGHAFDGARRTALAVFVVLALVSVVIMARGRPVPQIAVGGLLAGAVAAAFAALGWAGGPLGGIPLAVQLLVLAGATGGSLAALILGHWYLVTPRLSERPLVLVVRLLIGVVAVQILLFFSWMAVGWGGGRGPFEPLVGQQALLVWLRLAVGLVFPLVLSWMALRTARTRSMESATGLLYIDLAAIVSGTIVAAALYFAAGLLL